MTTTTKKMLVAVNIEPITMRKGGFVIPSQDENSPNVFAAIDGTGTALFACVSYTGRDLDANTLLARYIESGAKVQNVDKLLADLDYYLTQVKSFKVGSVLGVRMNSHSTELYLAHERPPDGAL
ncbi:hypothetical protein LOC71_18885 [Rhodopirellula sp. JC740]|uniref:Uncharacterized protein n=1 Tax=Rhodopirellula halodulae TaxID=2894198 RepID=A0ABS8NLA3_9BACT|nr:hypothetical protein [Rhodopirellula sp. JC740]MCC9644348.1 hypothetical protein [Rhodopirellula sp. JC740]